MSLAKTIGGDHSNDASPPPFQSENETDQANENHSSINDLLSGLSGGMDPELLKMLFKVTQEYGSAQNDKNLALITALRPFLKEKRQAKIEQAIQLARISRIVRVAFRTMKGGEESV